MQRSVESLLDEYRRTSSSEITLIWLVADLLDYYSTAELPQAARLQSMFVWFNWPGYLAVPFGLWLASKMPRTGPT